MINVPAVGRLVKDIELGETKNGKPYARFTLACKNGKNDPQGNAESTFIECVQWGKRAETLMRYTAKGSLLGVIGVLENNNYTDKEGIKRYNLQLNVSDFEFLESSEQTTQRQQTNNQQQQGAHPGQPNGQYQSQVDQITNAQQNNHNQGQQGYPNQQQNNQGQPPQQGQFYSQPPMDGMNQYGAHNGQ